MAKASFLGQQFPELELVDDPRERKSLIRRVTLGIYRRPLFWFRLVILMSSLITFAVVFALYLRRWLPYPAIVGGVLGGVAGGGSMLLLGWIVRDEARRMLREMLRAQGVPVCLACGYSLRGAPEPRCPECGAPSD